MYSEAIRRAAGDLAWSLWSELGVPGVARKHSSTSIDLEPLLVFTPTLAHEDPRLLEQVLSWCVDHADRVNAGRLATLVKKLPPQARVNFEAFATTVNHLAGTRWPAAGQIWDPLPRLRPVPLPIERPALVRLRARALCGVGSRADVLCDLLARPGAWSTAAMLAEAGHSKRNVARTLSELEAAGIVVRLPSGNALRFRLTNPAALATVLGGVPPASPQWLPVFELVTMLLDLAAMEGTSSAVRRVQANTLHDAVAPLAQLLGLAAPPQTRGEPQAWELLARWGAGQVDALASGTSAALGAEGARPAVLPMGGE
ncbi:MAG: hypothetical protein V4850_28295 [Myxococcota bacterium]